MITYIPLRVYSVYSCGEGTVPAARMANALKKTGVKRLAVTDPLSVLAWESCCVEAARHNLKPLPGVEIRFAERGALLLYPQDRDGYLEVVDCLNRRKVPALEHVTAVALPATGDPAWLAKMARKVPAGSFFLGLEWHSPQARVGEAQRMGIPLAWAQPVRWLDDPRSLSVARAAFHHLPLQEALAEDRKLDGLLTAAAIVHRWREAGKAAIAGTFRLAEQCAFSFDRLEAPAPAGDEELERRIAEALQRKRAGETERRRAAAELSVVRRLGFSAYFLIAAEVGEFCRRRGIFFHVRGSAGASLLLHLLGVSRQSPLPAELLFERFVNSRRDDLPDIDLDIESSRRAEVLAWVMSRYRGRAAFLSSHKFFAARSALYETARAGGLPPAEAHALTRPLPLFAGPRQLLEAPGGSAQPLYTEAARLDGVFKELSLHVGGVVFTAGPIDQAFPIERSPGGDPQIPWDKDTVERLKIFKLDLLGVRGFDVISPLAREERDPPFDDPAVWREVGAARTIGCFQIESPLSRENLLRVRPQNLTELAVCVAIIRPGPAKAGMKETYAERRPPLHPMLGRLFPATRGALIYEEQVSRLLASLCGWDLETAEKVRRDLKKGRGENWREEFFRLGRLRGAGDDDLALFWKVAGNFSLYAFCQAHSTAYGYSAYLSAWLKVNRPVEFFRRLFNAGGGYYPLPVYVEEARRRGVAVLPPDVNRSEAAFSAAGTAVRTGLLAVKGVGEKLAARIVAARSQGEFRGIEDFRLRAGAGERELAALLSASAFTSLGLDAWGGEEKEARWRQSLGFLPGPPLAPDAPSAEAAFLRRGQRGAPPPGRANQL